MCGRFTVTVDERKLEQRFGARFVSGHFEPTYNAAPSQLLPIIATPAVHQIVLGKWGFVPEGWRSQAHPQINARIESAGEKQMFASAYRSHHCLVLADGFYEWKETKSGKQPFRFQLKDGGLFAMAGIFARSHDEHGPATFAILTTDANDAVRPVHHRMPVMLPLGHERDWLPPIPSGMLVISPFPAELMISHPVTRKMSRASFNEPKAIAPLEPAIT